MATAPKQVLLIEDEVFLGSLLKTRLEKEGLSVTYAKSGDEAIEDIQKNKPDIVILDLILPGRSGFEVLEVLKSDMKDKKIPIIILSNLAQETDIDRVRHVGSVVDYFVKAQTPIDTIIKRVRELGSAVAVK